MSTANPATDALMMNGVFNRTSQVGTPTTIGGNTANFLGIDLGSIDLDSIIQALAPLIEQMAPFLEAFGIDVDGMVNKFAGGADAAEAAPDQVAQYEQNTARLGTSSEAVEAAEAVEEAGFTHISAAELYDATAEADINNGDVSFEIGAEFDLSGGTYTLVSQLDHESGVRAYTLEDTNGGLFTVVPGMDLPKNYAELSAGIESGESLTSLFSKGSGAEFALDRKNILAERGGLFTPGEGSISEQRAALADYLAHVEESFPDGSHIQIGHSFGASLTASIPGTSGFLFAPAGVNQTVAVNIADINDRFDITAGGADPVAEILGRKLGVDREVELRDLGEEYQAYGHMKPSAVLAPTS